jgi:excisionase family DNA binding protein
MTAGADEPNFLTTQQIAADMQVHERTVIAWIKAGRLPGLYLGSRKAGYRVRREDYERFARINMLPAEAAATRRADRKAWRAEPSGLAGDDDAGEVGGADPDRSADDAR